MFIKKMFFEIFEKPSSLQDDILQRFSVSKKFLLEYKKQQSALDWKKRNWEDFFGSMNPVSQMYVVFAMSTVLRGRDMFSLLESHSCIRSRKRYLDIGTAYAGFLRAFKEQGFKEVIGIELQESLAHLGMANIDGLDDARVIVGDFIQNDYSFLGAFDVVTCNDVIEHVDDAIIAIKKMSSMVTEGGVLAMEVPNRDCISFVTSDGHFQIFGITQLNRDDAALYYEAVLKADRKNYFFQMGEMYELDWYVKQLSQNGLNAFVADTHRIGGIKDVPGLLVELKQAYEDWYLKVKPRLEPLLAERMTNAVNAYIQKLEQDVSHVHDETSRKRFEDKYLRSFWTILAIKGETHVVTDAKRPQNEQIIQMRRSFFWKLSRPLRFLKRFIISPHHSFYELLDFLRIKNRKND